MSDKVDDTATIHALLKRLTEFRLPRTLALKTRVDAGERMTDEDIAFLKEALEDAHHGAKFVKRNPEFHDVGSRIVSLYHDIVSKAAENENRA